MVTRKQKIRKIKMPTWVIQYVGALTMKDRGDLSGGDEPLFAHQFTNENDFASALHEGGIAGVAQDEDEQDNDNGDDNANMDEDPDDSPGIAHDPAEARR